MPVRCDIVIRYHDDRHDDELSHHDEGVRSIVSRLREWEIFDGTSDTKILFDLIDTIRLCYKVGRIEDKR